MSTIQAITIPASTHELHASSAKPSAAFQKAVSSFFAASCIFLLLNIIIFLAPPRWDLESGLAASMDKHSRLHNCKSPKVVFIGGSNVMAGLDSKTVQEALQRDVVNMGLGISLGLRYQLEEVREDINPGDLLVVMPEYCNFYFLSKDITNAHLNGSSDLIHLLQVYPYSGRWIWKVYSSSPDALFSGLDDVRRYLLLKIQFYKKVFVKVIHRPNMIYSRDLLQPTNTIFTRRKNYNSYGDLIAHLTVPAPPLSPFEPIAFSDYTKFNTEATNFLNDYQAYAKSRGASLVLLPPVFPRHLKCEAITLDIYDHWKKLLTIPVLASPTRYEFDWSELYDSEYHTNAKGRRRRTALVIEDLLSYLSKH